MEKLKLKENQKLLFGGIFLFIAMLAIVGYTYSFFQAQDKDTGTITGTVASVSLSIEVNKLAPDGAEKGLVPQLDDYITAAVVGRNNLNCVDDNNNTVCQVYEAVVTNNSSVAIQVDGLLELNAGSNPNLKWAIIDSYQDAMTTKPNLVGEIKTHTETEITTNETYNANQTKRYYIVVWISETTFVQADTGVFTGTITFKDHENSPAQAQPNVPDLANNSLIPVMYDESTSRWVKADTTSSTSQYGWYDYDEKKWANAVLVTNTNRGTYQNASAGTPITESDILAYYVWIPRYKYKVWNINKEVGTDTYDAYTKGIDIVFEVEDATTGTITCDSYSYAAPVATKGEPNEECSDKGTSGYYTHPAFTFGDDKLSGFWIGKFELSSTDQTAENYGGKDRIDLTPRILPDVMSWRYNTVGNFWKVIYDMQTTDNIYGLPTDRTEADSHMLTNMEWGAVAYLAHSEYGRCTGGTCTEIAKNNSGERSNYTNYTGRSSGVGGSSGYTVAGTYTYKETNGQLASTTGNIYGVYDMSGGAYEYVMGNIGTSAGQTSGVYAYYASSAGSNYTYTGFEKYLTPYAYGTTYNNQTAYNRGRLGDATSEVVRSTGGSGGWYGDYAYFPYSSDSWFRRGGYFNCSTYAGPFNFFGYDGGGFHYYSARASLASVSS